MSQRTSISHIQHKKKSGRLLRPLIATLIVLSLVLTGLVIWVLAQADRLMRDQPEPLPVFNSNVMPRFDPVSFVSLDQQTTLHGWFMPAKNPVSTIILVHDIDSNRLQFGLQTPKLYRQLIASGFNVLSFDLRNTGQSGGQLSAYGYAEWADVIAAISFVQRYATTSDVLLYGFGTGVSASLIAWGQLPAPRQDKTNLPEELKDLPFDRSYIKGLLLDMPPASPDDAISARYADRGRPARDLLASLVPYAVRLSAGGVSQTSHVTLLGSCHLPVFLAAQQNTNPFWQESTGTLIKERQASHPDLTAVFLSETSGYLESFGLDQDEYLAALTAFLNYYFPYTP